MEGYSVKPASVISEENGASTGQANSIRSFFGTSAEERKVAKTKQGRPMATWTFREDLTLHNFWWSLVSAWNIPMLILYFTVPFNVSAIMFTLINVVIGATIREADFIAVLYWIMLKTATRIEHKWTKYIYLRLLHCIGGAHTGSMMWGFIWLWVYLIKELYVPSAGVPSVVWGTSIPLPICFTLIMVTAFPSVRRNYHNVFEFCHRYVN